MFICGAKNGNHFSTVTFFKIKCELETWMTCSCFCLPDGLLATLAQAGQHKLGKLAKKPLGRLVLKDLTKSMCPHKKFRFKRVSLSDVLLEDFWQTHWKLVKQITTNHLQVNNLVLEWVVWKRGGGWLQILPGCYWPSIEAAAQDFSPLWVLYNIEMCLMLWFLSLRFELRMMKGTYFSVREEKKIRQKQQTSIIGN